ncbi:MAG: hypothetical protein PHV17_05385 [Candidatus Omnitrophica bacterium]|nr:hypothetical protein [Candidatus Omnitrophota bacterium]
MFRRKILSFFCALFLFPLILNAQDMGSDGLRSISGVIESVVSNENESFVTIDGQKIFVENEVMDDVGFIEGDKVIFQVIDKAGSVWMVGYEFDFSSNDNGLEDYDDSSIDDYSDQSIDEKNFPETETWDSE